MANLNPHLRVELPKEWIEVSSCGKDGRMGTSWRVCAHRFGTWRLFLKCLLGELQCSGYSFQRAESRLLQLANIRASKANKVRILWIPLRLRRIHQSEYCWAQAMRDPPCIINDANSSPIPSLQKHMNGKTVLTTNTPLKRNCFSVLPRTTTSNYPMAQNWIQLFDTWKEIYDQAGPSPLSEE